MNSNVVGWDLYFSGNDTYEEYEKSIEIIQDYIVNNGDYYDLAQIESTLTFEIDTEGMRKSKEFKKWPKFQADLEEKPELILKIIAFAAYNLIVQKSKFFDPNDIIYPRIVNWNSFLVSLKDLKVNYFGKLVSFNGTVLRVSQVELICIRLTFKCDSCNEIQVYNQPNGSYVPPEFCKTTNCRNKSKFSAIFSCDTNKTIKYQVIRLRELITDEKYESGRIPRCIDCELYEDLVYCCMPGDDVTVTGVVKVRNFDEKNARKKQNSIFDIFVHVNSVINNKKPLISEFEFSTNDHMTIKRIHSESNIVKLLVHSMCPAIYGHEMIKMGLLLAMFGASSDNVDVRECIHVLVVGDPGLGKSKMLQACSDLAPRGVYICGTNSTNSGLTASLSKESGNEYSVTAGALVLADQGCCCIDEFDKMGAQHSSLLEVMEHQCVSIAKAGIVCKLPARSTILAAANPVDGHYNKAKSVSDNLRMNLALLSRFDLIFILLDEPDQQTDCHLSNYILKRFPGSSVQSTSTSVSSSATQCQISDIKKSLQHRLKLESDEGIDVLPQNTFRKYIAYARKHIRPKLSQESITILNDFFLELRKESQKRDMIPITTRQLESIIRLTKARAKIDFREVTSEVDAQDVIELFKFTLNLSKVSNDFQQLSKSSFPSSSSFSKKKVEKLMSLLQKKTEILGKSILTFQEMKEAGNQCDYNFEQFQKAIDFLNLNGFILKKDSNSYRIVK